MHDNSSQLLDQQLELLDRQADLDRWKHDHELALLRFDVSDLVALALATLERIKMRPAMPQSAGLHYFRRWHQIALRVLACVEFMEGRGFQPDGTDRFRFAINEASLAALHYEQIVAAQKRLDAGNGRSLDEILHGTSSEI